MALPVCTWEVRSGCSGSGGFKTGGTGTDYSQSDTPHLSFTDLEVKLGVFTRVYSVTEDANLTADCVDNTIIITGDGGSGLFTPGIYHVSAQGNDGNNFLDVDRACATGNANDGIAALGGAVGSPEDIDAAGQVGQGHVVYIKAGTYTLAGNCWFVTNGATANRIKIYGYNTTRGDNPEGTDRPLIDCGAALYFRVENNYDVEHIRFTGSSTIVFYGDNYGRYRNLYARNTSGAGGRDAFYSLGANGIFIWDCEGISDGGYALRMEGNNMVRFCYVHDSVYGIRVAGTNPSVEFCIADTITNEGIIDAGSAACIKHNTCYNCGDGIDIQSDGAGVVLNNCLDSCTNGIAGNAGFPAYLNYNNYYNNTNDLLPASSLTKGDEATANDPQFTDAAGGDFSGVQNASAFAMRLGVG